MVIVEPFRWIKATALTERLQLANKLNEVIDVLNQYPVNIDDIDMRVSSDGVFTFIFTLSDGTTKEMSFSMGDYLNSLITTALSSYYTKIETNNLLLGKANISDVYNKSETDNLLLSKANVNDVTPIMGTGIINTVDDFIGGDCIYIQIGKLVLVSLRAVACSSTGDGKTIANNLPKCRTDATFHGTASNIHIGGASPIGNIWIDAGATNIKMSVYTANQVFWHTFIYVAE